MGHEHHSQSRHPCRGSWHPLSTTGATQNAAWWTSPSSICRGRSHPRGRGKPCAHHRSRQTGHRESFRRGVQLEDMLLRRGRADDLEWGPSLALASYFRPARPLGLGHAVLCAARGDRNPSRCSREMMCSTRMAPRWERSSNFRSPGKKCCRRAGSTVEHVSATASSTPRAPRWAVGCLNIVEKPEIADAKPLRRRGPLRFSSRIFDHLANLKPGVGGEYQLPHSLKIGRRRPARGC